MTDYLFSPGKIGSMTLANRLVRSATAERMADDQGKPPARQVALYRELALGGVGLIITGHMFVHPSGKAHDEMTGVYSDDLIPGLAEIAGVVHGAGGKVVAQINHGGMQASAVPDPMAPSAVALPTLTRPARAMSQAEIEMVIQAFGEAARRVKAAGFDGVQIHGAHGYLVNQFLSPLVNQRDDGWGGSLEGRMLFLRGVCRVVRQQVGADFPVLIKLGMQDHMDGGLPASEGVQVVAELEAMGVDAVEISGGIGTPRVSNSRKGIRDEAQEGYFLPLARLARPVTRLPLLVVGGFRSHRFMEQALSSGDADFISLCRPLIMEPDLPKRMQLGLQERSRCLSANNCWPKGIGEGVGCKCPEKPE